MNTKKNIFIFILLMTVCLHSCGYKKLNNINKNNIHIKNIEINGDNKISYILKNEILLGSSKIGENKLNLLININKRKETKQKNITGKITKYNIILEVDVIIDHINKGEKIKKKFIEAMDYDVAGNHSDTLLKEKKSTENLSRRISEEITFFIKLYFKN